MSSSMREQLDQRIITAISGCDDLPSSHIHIENDYMKREMRENLEEQGYEVDVPADEELPLPLVAHDHNKGERFEDPEKQIWRNQMKSSQSELSRAEEDKARRERELEPEEREGNVWFPTRTFEIV